MGPGPRLPRADPELARRQAEFDAIYGTSNLRILQFYLPEGDITEGSPALLCYGVLNARSVRIEPSVEGVGPALNRCVEAAPERTTRYTLIAEGEDGPVASESLVLKTHADPATLPNIKAFRIMRSASDGGRSVYLLTFTAENAEWVPVEPRAFPPVHRAPDGRFYVMPERTTTDTLTVEDARGRKVEQRFTLEVPPRETPAIPR